MTATSSPVHLPIARGATAYDRRPFLHLSASRMAITGTSVVMITKISYTRTFLS
jgi:hypothetical protein